MVVKLGWKQAFRLSLTTHVKTETFLPLCRESWHPLCWPRHAKNPYSNVFTDLKCLPLNWFPCFIWAPSSEFVSSSIPSWQILTAHAQPFRGARDLAFCLKVPLDSLVVWASSEGSGETARMRRLAWTFAARIGAVHLIWKFYDKISP